MTNVHPIRSDISVGNVGAGSTPPSAGGPSGGGGTGNGSGLEPRLAVVESITKRVEITLDRIELRLQKNSDDISSAREGIKNLASADKVSEISASLKDKPSTWQTVLIAVLISGLTVAATLGGAAKFLVK